MAEGMTITELADAVGMTPRNIRAHQSKGLLFPPAISGRVALYNGAHLARLAAHRVAAARGLHAGRHQAAHQHAGQLLGDRRRPAAPVPGRQLGHLADRAHPGGAHPQPAARPAGGPDRHRPGLAGRRRPADEPHPARRRRPDAVGPGSSRSRWSRRCSSTRRSRPGSSGEFLRDQLRAARRGREPARRPGEGRGAAERDRVRDRVPAGRQRGRRRAGHRRAPARRAAAVDD